MQFGYRTLESVGSLAMFIINSDHRGTLFIIISFDQLSNAAQPPLRRVIFGIDDQYHVSSERISAQPRWAGVPFPQFQ